MLHGYSLPKYGADGSFGAETENAVRAFQLANGLVVDGVAGTKTMAAFASAEKAVTYTVTLKGLSKETADAVVQKYGGVMTAEGGATDAV